jgi:hypothetical protein
VTVLRRGFPAGLSACLAAALAAAGLTAAGGPAATASAAGPPTVNLRILLVGEGSADPTTAAWQAALTAEGVPYALVTASGSAPSETVNLPALSSGGAGNFNGVVIADSPADYASGQLAALDTYESSFGVRQVDGYMFPSPALGVTDATGRSLDGTTGTLTQAGLAAFGELKGPVPFDAGTYGYGATVDAGAPYTPFLTDAAGHVMAGVYQHPDGDPQAGVAELALNFDYNASQTQWLLLAPALINWVTQDTHLGLYRNYFGEDIDDVFIAGNEWSRQFQCTPAASGPPDYTCPPGVANNPADTPPDVQMSAADVAYVDAWEKQAGIRLNLAFNGIGACSAPTAADESSANCTGSATDNGVTYTDPGQDVDPSNPNDGAFVNALLASQGDFNWITHTWSHLFLGCVVWQPQPLTSVSANLLGGNLAAGIYHYEITAATAYGESEPSTPQAVIAGPAGSVTLTWPEASNGFSTDGGTSGPSLAQEEASHTGGHGFWGYNIYREDPGTSSYGLVGQVPENPSATSGTTYAFTDAGATAGVAPNSGPDFPTATNPGIDCAGGPDGWRPASSSTPDSSIAQEIGLDQAFAAANGLTNYTPAAVVTGEHSGVENPNMPSALNATNVTTFAQDASRQPQQYSLGNALGAPRYPSNIYYNASNWPDELNEYNTLYVKQGVPLGDPGYPGDAGHCVDTAVTTCVSQPATEAGLLASETHIMMGHVLANDPRVGYAHQSDLIGPATQNGQDYGYTILTLIDSMLSQYNDWFTATAPLDQMTDVSEAQVLAEQGAWAAAAASGQVTATESGGTVTITNNGSGVKVPVTVPPGTTGSGGAAFGQPYGGVMSAWDDLGNGATQTLTENQAPVITSAAAAASIVGSAFSFTVRTSGAPAPAITESGALPAGVTFTDNGDGTATIAGTPAAGTGGSYTVQLTATNPAGGVSTSFTLTNAQAPSIVSPPTATFTATVRGSYTVTTTGYPAATITETGTLPTGLSFTDNGNGTATISGTPASGTAGNYPVTISAKNASGSTATLQLTIAVQAPAAPAITSGNIAFFTAGQAGAAAVTTTGSPVPAISETGGLPGGLSFHDNGNGTALISGTATVTGTASFGVRASNGLSPDATQNYSVIVGRAPSFTSGNSAAATLGSPFSFTVKAGGYPAPSWGESGLPPGVSFTGNGDGTATISGTPTTAGTYPMPLMATNAYGSAQQTLTITVQQAPAITSRKSAGFTVGAPGSFSVQTTGSPVATINESGTLPPGITFTDNGDGTATLAGTPAPGTSGSYPLTITAANGVSPGATQSFALTVNPATPAAPDINSGGSAAFTVGTQGSFSVLTTGNPAASISESGALPSGVSFTDNGDGTATLAGTPASGTSGSYPLTITAANGVSPGATQSFTLTVNPATVAPVITSTGAATFATGHPGSFEVTATGLPAPALSATSTPALPSGVSFTDNGDGTATLAGTPPQGSQGSYLLTIKAASTAGTASQSFLLTINSGLTITSAATDTATAGSAFSFKVTTAGTPAPTLDRSGALPAGVTFTDNGDGTGTLSGTPTATGSFPLTFTARNATGTTSQAFRLTVDKVPAFTTATTIKETAGMAFTAIVGASGFPAPKLTSSGLPDGVTFSDDGGGAGTLSGTTAVKPGTYPVTVTASNAAGTVTQTITLSVKAAGSKAPVPAFTSAAAATAATGQPVDLSFTTAGSPTGFVTNITRNGALPAGLTFTNNGDGTATLTGTPSSPSGGNYPITLSAQTAGGVTTQAFVLTVTSAPAIVTGTSATATVGSGFNFTVRAKGFPAPTLTETGAIPQGLSWTDNGDGTATLAGAPGVAQGGVYKLTFTAASVYGTVTQSFTLTVVQAPGMLSAPAATAAGGKPFSFTFAAAGYPIPVIGHSGSVPGLKFGTSSNGALTLSGTPTAAGTYSLTITARNSVGSVTQAFTLAVS